MTKKGKERAKSDVGLMFIAYNLRRIINILDADILKKFFQELAFSLLGIFALQKLSAYKCRTPILVRHSLFFLPPSYPLKYDYIYSRIGVLRLTDVIGQLKTRHLE